MKHGIVIRPTNMAIALANAAARSIITAPDHKSVPWQAKRVAINEERGVGLIKEPAVVYPKREDGVVS